MSEHHTRVVIVGGGPVGLEMAVALRRAEVDHVVLEAKQVGHTMSWWAPQTKWFSSNERIAISGVPLVTPDQQKATREQYLAYLRGIVQEFDLPVRPYAPVTSIEQSGDGFVVTAAPRGRLETFDCEAVVLAVGGTDFPRELGIEGEDLPHVDGYLREPHDYFGRRVLVIGGRNSAVEAALRCHHAGAKVALSYRGPELPGKSIKYWLLPEIEGLLKSGRIEPHFGTRPVKITPTHVTLERDGGETYDVAADEVLSLIGYAQDQRLMKRAGVELEGESQHPAFDPTTMETNVPGLYIAGTAVAGTQSSHYKIFLENCHIHVHRILAHLQGEPPPDDGTAGLPAAMQHLADEVAATPES